MAYIQRIITMEVEFNLFEGNKAFKDKEDFANEFKKLIDRWTFASHSNIVKVQDFLHDNDDKNEN